MELIRYIVAALIFLFVMTAEEQHFSRTLKNKIKTGQHTIPLTDLVKQSWDTVCVLSPYSLGPTSSYDPGVSRTRAQKWIKADKSEIANLKNDFLDVSQDNMWAFIFIGLEEIKLTVRSEVTYYYTMDAALKHAGKNCFDKNTVFVFTAPNTLHIKPRL